MQTKAGGEKFKETMIKKHGSKEAWKAFMGAAGAIGGSKGRTGGFYHAKYVRDDLEFVRECGRKGGKLSIRKRKDV